MYCEVLDRSDVRQYECLLGCFSIMGIEVEWEAIKVRARWRRTCAITNVAIDATRVLRSAMRAIKLCLDQGHIALADRVVEKATYYKQHLGRVHNGTGTESTELQTKLSIEYYLMRIALVSHLANLCSLF
jgi:hypothetical protein